MNIRGFVTIILLLCYSTGIAFSQTLDLQFATEIDCDLELYHVTLQTKVTQTGQTANLGNTSILFEYNASALDFQDYESIHFDGSDMCIGAFAAWGPHGIDGVSDGIFNLTINLEVPVNETQAFASCPTITDEWEDIAKITFSIANMNSTSNLVFSQNDEYISFNNYFPNDGSDQLLDGIFYDLNEPFVCTILEAPTANITTNTNSGNAPLPVNFSGSDSNDSDGTIVSYAWDFGDGSTGTGENASHTYTTSGTYTATLTVTDDDGLTDETTVSIIVSAALEAPTANITTNTNSGNAPLPVNFSGSDSNDSDGTIVSYAWDFGDGSTGTGENASHTYTTSGTYTATLTVTDDDGLTDGSLTTISVGEELLPPTAIIVTDSNSGNAPLPVSFDGSSSTDSDGSISSYSWNFGDGSTDSGSNVNHTFSAGTYTVTLTVTDNDGLTDVSTTTILVGVELELPTAEITANTNSGEAPLAVNFSGSNSSDSDGTIVSYAWDFGDGSMDSGVNASHSFTEAGSYTVSLTVTDNDGLTNTATTTIVVNEEVIALAPTAEITANTNSGEAPLAVNFSGSNSSDSDGTIVSYAWDFGDGSTDSGVNASYSFTEAGSYTVSLTVTDNDGLTNTATTTIVVNEEVIALAPTAEITANTNSGEAPLAVNFSGSNSSDSDGTIVSYAWDFGDGSTDSGVNASHTFSEAGSYTVSLTVTDNDGLTNTATTTIVVNEEVIALAPTAEITANTNSGEAPLAVNFSGSNSSDSDGTIVSYAWDFGDGSTDSGVNASYSFTEAGSYTVSLTVTDNDGLTNTATTTIVVNEEVIALAPTAEITANTNSGEAPLAINFSGSNSSDSDGTIVSYAWDFGNGVSGNGMNSNYLFTTPGEYIVSLTVTDNDGLTNTATTTITVSEAVEYIDPIAIITLTGPTNLGGGNYQVDLDGSESSDPDGGDLTYEWFVDGELFDTDDVTVLILPAGASADIELKVTDDEGDTVSDFASVSTDCEIDITEVYEDFTKMICSGEEVNIREVFANDIPEIKELIDQEGKVVLETEVLSFNNSSCDVADFIFTIHYTEEDTENCTATFYNYTYIIGVYPNLSGQIEYQDDCVIHLNTCEQFDVTWSDGVNAGEGVSYSGDLEEGVITFLITDTAAPGNCSSMEVNAEISCVVPCNDAEKNVCIDPTLTAELCPEFCDLPNDDYIIVSAHTQYNCSLQLLGNNCINFIPVQGFTGISKVEIVACTQITSSEILCDTVYYNVAVGDCEQAPSQNATIEEINNNCEIEDINLCVAPYETEEICLDFCGVTKVIVDIKSSLNSIVGIENSNCINYIPNPFYESGIDEIEIFVCDLDVNCQTVKITIDIDPACSSNAESRMQVADCENLFSTVLTPNNDGRNDIWRVKNTGSCFDDYNEMKLTIIDKFGNVVHQTFDGELPQWDGKISRGQQADEGVYYYILQVMSDEKTIPHTGYIELRY